MKNNVAAGNVMSSNHVKPYLMQEDVGNVCAHVGMIPGCVLIHSGSLLWQFGVPVIRNIIGCRQILQYGVTVTQNQSLEEYHTPK